MSSANSSTNNRLTNNQVAEFNMLINKLKGTYFITSGNKKVYTTRLINSDIQRLINILKNDTFLNKKAKYNLQDYRKKVAKLAKSFNNIDLQAVTIPVDWNGNGNRNSTKTTSSTQTSTGNAAPTQTSTGNGTSTQTSTGNAAPTQKSTRNENSTKTSTGNGTSTQTSTGNGTSTQTGNNEENKLKSNLEKHKLITEQLINRLTQLTQSISELQIKSNLNEKEKAILKINIEELHSQLSKRSENYNRLNEHLQRAQQLLKQQKSNQQNKQMIQNLESKLKESKVSLQILQSSLQQDNLNRTSILETTKQLLRKLQTEKMTLQTTINKVRLERNSQVGILSSEIEKLEQNKNALEENYQKAIQKLKGNLETVQKQQLTNRQAKKQVEKILVEKEKILTEQTRKQQNLEANLEKAKESLRNVQAKANLNSKEKEQLNLEKKELQAKLNLEKKQLQNQQAILRKELASTNEMLEQLKTRSVEGEGVIEQLRKNLNTVTTKLQGQNQQKLITEKEALRNISNNNLVSHLLATNKIILGKLISNKQKIEEIVEKDTKRFHTLDLMRILLLHSSTEYNNEIKKINLNDYVNIIKNFKIKTRAIKNPNQTIAKRIKNIPTQVTYNPQGVRTGQYIKLLPGRNSRKARRFAAVQKPAFGI